MHCLLHVAQTATRQVSHHLQHRALIAIRTKVRIEATRLKHHCEKGREILFIWDRKSDRQIYEASQVPVSVERCPYIASTEWQSSSRLTDKTITSPSTDRRHLTASKSWSAYAGRHRSSSSMKTTTEPLSEDRNFPSVSVNSTTSFLASSHAAYIVESSRFKLGWVNQAVRTESYGAVAQGDRGLFGCLDDGFGPGVLDLSGDCGYNIDQWILRVVLLPGIELDDPHAAALKVG